MARRSREPRPIITAARLRELLCYDDQTGEFAWRESRGGPAMLGAPVGSLSGGYIKIMVDGRTYAAHRLAFLYMTGEWPAADVDHIDGCRTNNRWSNMRAVSRRTNAENRRTASSSNRTGLLGVEFIARLGLYRARIRTRGVLHQLGCYPSAEDAHAAYLVAKRRLHEGCTL